VFGPLVGWIVGALEGAVVVGGLSALGAGLYSIGIPKDSIVEYETALKSDKFLVLAYGAADEGRHLLQTCASEQVGQRRKAAPFGIREAKATTAEFRFEHAIFFLEIGDDLLLVPLEPAGHHGDEHVQNHSLPSGWRHRQLYSVQYTPNLRNFNGLETAEIFNQTGLCPRTVARYRVPDFTRPSLP
jgi:hypothetical protein